MKVDTQMTLDMKVDIKLKCCQQVLQAAKTDAQS